MLPKYRELNCARIFVTGGAGFIGSAVIRRLLKTTEATILNFDKLTYASNELALNKFTQFKQYQFIKGDICDSQMLENAIFRFKPTYILHLAAESHVDRSITGPAEFITTNIVGTYELLEVVRKYYAQLSLEEQAKFKLHHISTDEVYGDLDATEPPFTEENTYKPSSPYAASKASSDHLIRAWGRTYALPIIITNCSNNYGPYQYPEKLIPLMIKNAIEGQPMPVYGDGSQVRDWLHVDDHASALCTVLNSANVGSTYNIGGKNEIRNIDLVNMICTYLEELLPNHPLSLASNGPGFQSLIQFVNDRAGHDKRYAIDNSKIQSELSWYPSYQFEEGLFQTVKWYVAFYTEKSAEANL
ncbi:dTDP-glucose 4,6-dehydratase [Pseudoalteromonas sp. T1lg65]|uniref:dTDP-glucose 4,6-dehydratase n=1 Tax=Pseudoalteromonas sp. T1lg65 TaxID=2077101 RepID=UPI003F79F9FB